MKISIGQNCANKKKAISVYSSYPLKRGRNNYVKFERVITNCSDPPGGRLCAQPVFFVPLILDDRHINRRKL